MDEATRIKKLTAILDLAEELVADGAPVDVDGIRIKAIVSDRLKALAPERFITHSGDAAARQAG